MTAPADPPAAKPVFGDTIRNPWTQPDNPLHLSTFVRVVRRNGRMNAGTWWEVTDRRGRFWQLKAEDAELVAGAVPDTGQPAAPAKDEETDWAEVVREEDVAAALDAVNHGGHGIRWSAVAEVLGAEVERLREEGKAR